jgi:hypothetical protein
MTYERLPMCPLCGDLCSDDGLGDRVCFECSSTASPSRRAPTKPPKPRKRSYVVTASEDRLRADLDAALVLLSAFNILDQAWDESGECGGPYRKLEAQSDVRDVAAIAAWERIKPTLAKTSTAEVELQRLRVSHDDWCERASDATRAYLDAALVLLRRVHEVWGLERFADGPGGAEARRRIEPMLGG